jgi:hypothetical protein
VKPLNVIEVSDQAVMLHVTSFGLDWLFSKQACHHAPAFGGSTSVIAKDPLSVSPSGW